ncbi:thioredoxin [Peniophora sp. CONT]|nr:thioredoxin [Peniophora sp. CONT]
MISRTARMAEYALRTSSRSFSSSVRRSDHFLKANRETFDRVIETRSEDRVVLVDFYADWCGPCKMLSPLLEEVTADEKVKSGSDRALDLVTVDTDVEQELAMQYGIRSLPTVIAFKDGKPVSQFMGAVPAPALHRFIESL